MQRQPLPFDPQAVEAFVDLAGRRAWEARLAEIDRHAASGPRAGRAVRHRHALERAIERLRHPLIRPPSDAELRIAQLATEAVDLARELAPTGRVRWRQMITGTLGGEGSLVPLFHLLRTAALQRSRGFNVEFAALEHGAPFDLLIARDAGEAEVVCDVMSAEDGRLVHRSAWLWLVDRVELELRDWLAANPGRYLLKMTLPEGLRGRPLDIGRLTALQERIRSLLANRGRNDDSAGAVLRLGPLVAGDAKAGLPTWLRREFGPEAHLSVTATGQGVLVLAARAARADAVAVALRDRLPAVASARLSGTRPGILAMFIDDTARDEWRGLRERFELEGEARQFLCCAAARPVVAVTCASRFEMFGMPPPDASEDGELRFRNAAHPAAEAAALAPAVLSSV
ncbi:MAG: hypothetical protein JO157_10625 [Acetobacteraceae bacterium]|nr:hypothetical protein [Acetobacteraceae bacterium]